MHQSAQLPDSNGMHRGLLLRLHSAGRWLSGHNRWWWCVNFNKGTISHTIGMIVFWCFAQLLLVMAAVQLMGQNRWRHAASILVLAAAWLLPLAAPAIPLMRALMAAVAILALVKVVQLAQQPESDRWAPLKRLWHGLAPFDVSSAQRVASSVDRGSVLAALLHAGLALLALTALAHLPRESGVGINLARLGLGGTLVYCGMEAICEILRALHLWAGFKVPPIQRNPIMSQSIREFWSERWNLPVSGWLESMVFRPVNERVGPGAAVMAAFGVSGLLHGWMFLVSIGFMGALLATGFFLFNGLFVLVETTIRVRRFTPIQRRMWTLGMLGLVSPLYIEPALQLLGL